MKIKFVILTLVVVGLTFCKAKKSADAASTTTSTPAVKEELAADLKASAEARYPGVASADILEGQKLYYAKCGKCHGLPEVESQTEMKWPEWIDEMAPKANMDDAQKAKTLKYILAARDIKIKK